MSDRVLRLVSDVSRLQHQLEENHVHAEEEKAGSSILCGWVITFLIEITG
jgi:hypothetical protein